MKRGFLKTAKAKKTEGIGLPPVPPSIGVPPKGDGSLVPQPHIKLPYGKLAKTARPTEGFVSKQVFSREASEDTVDYSENTIVITTLPPVDSDATLDDEPDNWTECILAGQIKLRILSTPGFPRPVEKPAGGKVNHRVGPSPFGGLGLFATRPVHTGDLILAERPLLIAPRGFQQAVGSGFKGLSREQIIQVSMDEWEERLGIALKRMSDENREAFMALANSHTEDGSGPILGIIRTNGYQVPHLYDNGHEGDNTRAYSAVLKVMSRVNHSCSPNTDHRFDMASLSFQLRAIRDIKKGEELFYSYCDMFQTKSERAGELAPYGIVCACPGCVGATKETDSLRSELAKRVGKIQAGHLVWLKDRSRPSVLAASLKLIAEIEKEGLQRSAQLALLLGIVTNAYSASGNKNSAMKYSDQLDNLCRASTLGRSLESKGFVGKALI